MKVFIQKVKRKDRVKFGHGNQIFTIEDYNGYKGNEIEWLKNCLERFFESYDKSISQHHPVPDPKEEQKPDHTHPDKPERGEEQKTIDEILSEVSGVITPPEK
jgi:hypothetical protein